MFWEIKQHREKIALIDGDSDRQVTYDELSQLVDGIRGVFPKKKSLIFCFCRNTIEIIAAYLAALGSGHAICLLDADASSDVNQKLLELYHPHFVISAAPIEVKGDYETLDSPTEGIWFWRSKKGPELHPHLQLLLSTSGTTGSPKLIRLAKENLWSNAESIAQYLEIDEKERAIASLPIHYSYGLSVLNSHLLKGASLVLTSASVVQAPFWKIFNTYKCTSFAGVPYTYQILDRLRFQNFELPTLHTMTQAGGKLSRELIEKFHNLLTSRGARFVVMYGQTEATARIAYLSSECIPKKLGSIGKAIPGGTLKLFDGNQEIITPGEVGELVYSGKNVMLGYATKPEDLIKGDEIGGTLHTGDLGYFDENGIFFITGRLKRFSKVYGLRINLDEIEETLRTFGPVAVTGTDEKIYLHFEQNGSEKFLQCRKTLTSRYQLHHTTFEYREIAELPLTSSGKVDYTKLHEITHAS